MMKKIFFVYFVLSCIVCTNVFSQAAVSDRSSSYSSSWLSDDVSSKVGGFTFGYVNQYARCFNSDFGLNDAIVFQDGIWKNNIDKRLHGIFLGLSYQHQLGNSGFAIYWAIRTEYYYSNNKEGAEPLLISSTGTSQMIRNRYFEWLFNIPLHLQFSVPLGDGAVGFHTGPAYSLSVNGSYADNSNGNIYDVYKNGESRSNLFYEIAFFLQTVSDIRLDFTWSAGLSERYGKEIIESASPGAHGYHWNEITYYRNKFLAGITFLF